MKDKKERVSMSFWTALGLSANNLLTKKGRTLLTAFAGSIGIIGIALILALSSGVSDYIGSLEEDTMAEYPIEITSSQFDIAGMLSSLAPSLMGDEGEADEDVEISVSQVTTSLLTQREANDLGALKEYIESGESDILDNVKSVEYIYDVDPLIYLEEEDGNMRQVNPDTSFSMASNMSSIVSSMPISVSMSSFFVMPENESLFIDDYEVLAGHWPENYNECVLVLSDYGSISDYILYTLGLRDYEELDALVTAFENGETAEEIDDYGTYKYDDVIGVSYKVINSADLYAYDEEYDIWVDKSDNTDFVNETASNGEDLTIVGVVKPSEDAVTAILSSGINYPYSLIYHMSDLSEESGAVQAQMNNHNINIFTGEEFGEESDFDFSDMFTIDEDAFADAFNMDEMFEDFEFDTDSMDFSSMDFDMSSMDFDMSSMNLDLSSMSIDMSSMNMDMSSIDMSSIDFDMPEMDMSAMMGSMMADPTTMSKAMSELANEIVEDYKTWSFNEYLGSDEVKKEINSVLNNSEYWDISFNSENINELQELINGYNSALTAADVKDVLEYVFENSSVTFSEDGMNALVKALINGYSESIDIDFTDYLSSPSVITNISRTLSGLMDTSSMQASMSAYMESVMSSMMDSIMQQMQVQMGAAMQSSMDAMMDSMTAQLTSQLSSSMESMMSGMMDEITNQLTDSMTDMMSGMMDEITDQLSESMTDAFDFDSETMSEMFGIDMESADFTDMLLSISGSTGSSYSANLASLGYMDLENPTEIDLYPIDFDSKDRVTEILDEYNDRMEANGEPEKVISYTDLVGTMMSTVTTIINTVSYVLMAFIGVSLVVSAIMISVITQISVMERTKEIGILRAMGASKLNISEVFNAETFIIGLCSGLLGVIVSEILIIPINMIIHMLTGDTSVNAVLPFGAAAGLVVLSFIITVISGLIPSYRASKQDPVAALRTE